MDLKIAKREENLNDKLRREFIKVQRWVGAEELCNSVTRLKNMDRITKERIKEFPNHSYTILELKLFFEWLLDKRLIEPNTGLKTDLGIQFFEYVYDNPIQDYELTVEESPIDPVLKTEFVAFPNYLRMVEIFLGRPFRRNLLLHYAELTKKECDAVFRWLYKHRLIDSTTAGFRVTEKGRRLFDSVQ